MAILRMREIREMTPEKRREKLTELKSELSRTLALASTGAPLENPKKIRELRRTIARILTVENEDRRKKK
ncbi:MAG: 50S ribosomal protein L29 [Candidatus Methanomethylicia archaeon]